MKSDLKYVKLRERFIDLIGGSKEMSRRKAKQEFDEHGGWLVRSGRKGRWVVLQANDDKELLGDLCMLRSLDAYGVDLVSVSLEQWERAGFDEAQLPGYMGRKLVVDANPGSRIVRLRSRSKAEREQKTKVAVLEAKVAELQGTVAWLQPLVSQWQPVVASAVEMQRLWDEQPSSLAKVQDAQVNVVYECRRLVGNALVESSNRFVFAVSHARDGGFAVPHPDGGWIYSFYGSKRREQT